MFRKNSNKIGLLADEIKIRPLLTHYLTPLKSAVMFALVAATFQVKTVRAQK